MSALARGLLPGLLVLGWVTSAEASTIAVITRFTLTRDGQVLLDDTFSGPAASLAEPRMVDGQATGYSVSGFIPDGSARDGRLSLRSADGTLSATADGRRRRITSAWLMTNGDPQNAGAGLKVGSTFALSAVFDLVAPGGSVEGYGIGLGAGAGPRRAGHVVSLFVFRNEGGDVVLRFFHQDFEAHRQHVIAEPPLDVTAGDQIRLVLSRASLASPEVTAQYQLLRAGAPTSALIGLGNGAPVFGGAQRNWTRPEFFVFEQVARDPPR